MHPIRKTFTYVDLRELYGLVMPISNIYLITYNPALLTLDIFSSFEGKPSVILPLYAWIYISSCVC